MSMQCPQLETSGVIGYVRDDLQAFWYIVNFEQGLICVICIQYSYIVFLLLYSLYTVIFSAEIKYIIIIIIIYMIGLLSFFKKKTYEKATLFFFSIRQYS